jgi:L-2-hydroxyglutarate oxidase LhgO
VGVERRDRDYRIELRTPDGLDSLTSERVVNAAGLESDTVAGLAGIDVETAGYRLHWWKGSYFAVSGDEARRVSRLVYPTPNPLTLGIHAILGLDGRLRFGPDADYLPDRRLDYSPDIVGIRARLQGPGDGFRDFVIADEAARGRPGLVSLVGIDSPGLTSALAIAEEVDRILAE